MIFAIMEKLDELKHEIIKKGDRWYNTKSAITYTDVSAKTLERAVAKGLLKVSKQSGRNLYKQSELDRWLEGKNR